MVSEFVWEAEARAVRKTLAISSTPPSWSTAEQNSPNDVTQPYWYQTTSKRPETTESWRYPTTQPYWYQTTSKRPETTEIWRYPTTQPYWYQTTSKRPETTEIWRYPTTQPYWYQTTSKRPETTESWRYPTTQPYWYQTTSKRPETTESWRYPTTPPYWYQTTSKRPGTTESWRYPTTPPYWYQTTSSSRRTPLTPATFLKVGTAVFDASPYKVYEGHDTYLKVTCEVINLRPGIRSIVSIDISRKRDNEPGYTPLAHITGSSSPKVFDATHDAQVSGDIDETAGLGKLSIEWAYPLQDETGQYKCEIKALTTRGEIVGTETHYQTVEVVQGDTSHPESFLEKYRFLVTKFRLCSKSDKGPWEKMFAAALGHKAFTLSPAFDEQSFDSASVPSTKRVQYFLSNFTVNSLDFAESTCRHVFNNGPHAGQMARVMSAREQREAFDFVQRAGREGTPPVVYWSSQTSTCQALTKTSVFRLKPVAVQMCTEGRRYSMDPFYFLCEKVTYGNVRL
ncbi:uncharacterized protein LOC101852414 isoform X2 [Aplysia californica]|uniref:Uncharacterized protein LOC101852414 isoform X2 n=1 Tax=Aplysia californica TaxID=6500 RepID=A0ABM1VUN2_APLCA|nr:uncharacterized protein LOC101852414 isoform X2 [Aplysia californica]